MFWNRLSQCWGFVKTSERACRSGRAVCNRATWKETQFVRLLVKMWGERYCGKLSVLWVIAKVSGWLLVEPTSKSRIFCCLDLVPPIGCFSFTFLEKKLLETNPFLRCFDLKLFLLAKTWDCFCFLWSQKCPKSQNEPKKIYTFNKMHNSRYSVIHARSTNSDRRLISQSWILSLSGLVRSLTNGYEQD